MKKLLLISILLGLIFLWGCANKNQNTQDFDMKIKCANMKNEIQNEQTDWSLVDEVFYSKKYNSCLYITENFNIIEVNDYLNQKKLLRFDNKIRCNEVRWNNKNNLQTCENIYEEEMKKLKELKLE